METRKAGKKIINKKKTIFEAEKLYKSIIEEISNQGFIYAEKEQRFKPTQYGDETRFIILGFKSRDSFAKTKLTITVKLEDINKIKKDNRKLDEGNINILIEGEVNLDYNDDWNKSGLKKFLFKIYTKYLKKEEIKQKYMVPTFKDVGIIYKKLKEDLNLY